MAQIVTAQFVGQTSCGFVREKYYEIEIYSMKRPYRTLLTILAIAAIDVLFFYGLLWILRAICSAVALIVGLTAGAWFLY